MRIILRLAAMLGPPSDLAFQCPGCKAEGAFLVQFSKGGLCICVECKYHCGIGMLLAPEDEATIQRDQELQQAMAARTGPAGGAGPLR